MNKNDQQLSGTSTTNLSTKINWSINWKFIDSGDKNGPNQILTILKSQTFNDKELFQAVIRRDWMQALRYIKRMKIKVSSIHAYSTVDRATAFEEALTKLQDSKGTRSLTVIPKTTDDVQPEEVELAKLYIEFIDEFREMIIEIEHYLDEPFPAGNCNLYVSQVKTAFGTDREPKTTKQSCESCTFCKVF